jgi:hypothetical protein
LATFEEQVEALTGIAIDGSSDPTQTELSAFLVDGVKDVVNRMIEARPAELSKFTATSNETDAVVKTGKILSVVREHDSTTILRKCTAIDPGDRYDATDTDSLNYRSKTSPGYYELDGLIRTVPAAGSGNNDVVVTQVSYDTGVAYGDTVGSGIDNFPAEYEHLVGIYAAIKSIGAKMGATRASLSSFSVTAVPPDMPTTGVGLPTYEVSSTSVGSGTIDDEISKMLSYIETDEDVELASAKGAEINLRFKRALDKFNSDVAEYKTENEGEIAHYASEINAYTADVNAQVQEQAQKIATETLRYQWLQDRHTAYTQEYYSAFVVPGGE